MKKAVITLLGMISNSKPDYISVDGEVKKVFVDIKEKDRAKYLFSNELSLFKNRQNKERYINTLPLLIDIFDDRDIVPIATEKAKKIQETTLNFLKLDTSILDKTIIIDESDYNRIFQQISELLNSDKYDNFIIDLTHGFRHLPILMIVNLIITSIKDFDKVEHIFFAKEIVNAKEYEIIDLLDYIGLAKLAFVLQNFNKNYTVGNKLIFRNEKYQDLVDNLRIISGHILANSLKALIEGEDSLVHKTIKKLKNLQEEDKNIATFSVAIDDIIIHLEELQSLESKKEYIKLFKLSKIMKDREYLLNSITLLNESIGMYCAEKIREVSPEISFQIDDFLRNDNKSSQYELANQSKELFKWGYKFRSPYLSLSEDEEKFIIKKINRDKKFINLLFDIGNLRNNLAHGNSSEQIDNVKGTISMMLNDYKEMANIEDDIKVVVKVVENIESSSEIKKPKPKKEKSVSKGINVSEEKLSSLRKKFNNR